MRSPGEPCCGIRQRPRRGSKLLCSWCDLVSRFVCVTFAVSKGVLAQCGVGVAELGHRSAAMHSDVAVSDRGFAR